MKLLLPSLLRLFVAYHIFSPHSLSCPPPPPQPPPTPQGVVAFRSEDGGYAWNYSGTVLDASAVPESEEGPNENDIVLLPDNVTLMAIIRLDAGDGKLSHRYTPYVRVTSSDGGFTWGSPVALSDGVGCARPRLLSFPGGPVLLSGGRTGPRNRDVFLWVNVNGDGLNWTTHSITYEHNRLAPLAFPRFDSRVNDSQARETTSYTSLMMTGPNTGLLTYGLNPLSSEESDSITFGMAFVV